MHEEAAEPVTDEHEDDEVGEFGAEGEVVSEEEEGDVDEGYGWGEGEDGEGVGVWLVSFRHAVLCLAVLRSTRCM